MKIQEVTSNVATTEKNGKQYVRKFIQPDIRETHMDCSDKVTVDIHIVHSPHSVGAGLITLPTF